MSSQHSLRANDPVVLHSGPFMPSCRRMCALGTLSVMVSWVQVSSQNGCCAADAGDQEYLSAVPQSMCLHEKYARMFLTDGDHGSDCCTFADG